MPAPRSKPSEPGPPGSAGGASPAIIDPSLVGDVAKSILEDPRISHVGTTHLPDRRAVGELVELIREIVFPGFFGRRDLTAANLADHVQELLSRIALHLGDQVRAVLRYERELAPRGGGGAAMDDPECAARASDVAGRFVRQIPALRRALSLDVQAAFDGDPAARHVDETIFCYPGIDAIFTHRVAHALYEMRVPLLPRIIQEMAHSRTGIDIHPGARIGESFFIDHGGGVVIGETTRIGDHVRIYQGVTLGAKSFPKDQRGRLLRTETQRHPTIGSRVTIYAGAVILGGDTVIGDDCVISGSVFVTQSVPAGHVVREKTPELVLRNNRDALDAGG